jgi:hypothetical protein
MRFQFFILAQGNVGAPILSPVGKEFERKVDGTMGSLREDAIADAETRFAEVVKNRQPGDGQIVLMTPTLGEPPGAILALEVIDPLLKKARLQWAWHDGTIPI